MNAQGRFPFPGIFLKTGCKMQPFNKYVPDILCNYRPADPPIIIIVVNNMKRRFLMTRIISGYLQCMYPFSTPFSTTEKGV